MVKKRKITLSFPFGGENRGGRYAQQTKPYSTPSTNNVRPNGVLERRGRGGSRPGLVKWIDNDFGTNITAITPVTWVDGDGNHKATLIVVADGKMHYVDGEVVTETKAYLVDDNGNKIITDDGDYIIFNSEVSAVNPLGNTNVFSVVEHEGKLYIADSALSVYNPDFGTVSEISDAPTGNTIVCVYKERLVLAGGNHIYSFSRQGDFTDFTVGDRMEQVDRPVRGQLADSGRAGDEITYVASWKDSVLVMATADSLWYFTGDPSGSGSRKRVSGRIGVVGHSAACITDDGIMLFIARDGLYMWAVGSDKVPQRFGPERIPEELRDVDVTKYISMAYDHKNNGCHIYLNKKTDVELVLHFKCEEFSGIDYSVFDSSGNGNNGLVYDQTENPMFTDQITDTGKILNGFNFSNNNGKIDVSSSGVSLDSDTVSIGLWADCPSVEELISEEDRFTLSGGSLPQVVFYTDSGSVTAVATTSIGSGWRHLFATWDGYTARLYIDGVLVDSEVGYSVFTALGTGADNLHVCSDYDGTSNYNGYVDDVRIYNGVLSLSEIGLIYNSGTGSQSTLNGVSYDADGWWIDMEDKGIWPVSFANDYHNPLCLAVHNMSGDSDVLLACDDGYIRRFSNSATDDDGTDITSDLMLGPIHVPGEYGYDGLVEEVISDFADNSETITWKTIVGSTAEEAVDKAVASFDGDGIINIDKSGSWSENHNYPRFPRSRGAWVVLWISSTGQWSYESITFLLQKLGRLRNG